MDEYEYRNRDQYENENNKETTVVGGAVRNISRNIRILTRTVSRSTIGRLPHVPPKTIAKSAGNLGDVLDISDKIKSAHAERTKNNNSQETVKMSRFQNLIGKLSTLKVLPGLLFHAFPGILKSSVLGTVVFSIYESCVDVMVNSYVRVQRSKSKYTSNYKRNHEHIQDTRAIDLYADVFPIIGEEALRVLGVPYSVSDRDVECIDHTNTESNSSHSDENSLMPHMPSWISSSAAITAGVFAGSMHGALLFGWNHSEYLARGRVIKFADWLKNSTVTYQGIKASNVRFKRVCQYLLEPFSGLCRSIASSAPVCKPATAIWGTCVMHSYVHGALFGTYVMTKQVLLNLTELLILNSYRENYHDVVHPLQDAVADRDLLSGSNSGTGLQAGTIYAQHLHRFENLLGITVVTIAGGFAGAVSEYVTIICDSRGLDSVTMRNWISEPMSHPNRLIDLNIRVPLRQIFGISIILPSALGFLAYEYGKSLMERHEGDESVGPKHSHLHALKYV